MHMLDGRVTLHMATVTGWAAGMVTGSGFVQGGGKGVVEIGHGGVKRPL